MTANYLADSDPAATIHNAAFIAGMLSVPLSLFTVGVVLLILGLSRRSAARTQTQSWPARLAPPGYPPSVGYPAAPPRPASSGTKNIVVGAVLLGLGVFALSGTLTKLGGISNGDLAAGDCVGGDTWVSGDPKRIDCSSADAVEQLADKAYNGRPCPDGEYDGESVYDQLTNESTRLCFQWNLDENQCYLVDLNPKTPPITPADCTNQDAVRIVKRVDGSADTSVCTGSAMGIAYPLPPRTYCVEAASDG